MCVHWNFRNTPTHTRNNSEPKCKLEKEAHRSDSGLERRVRIGKVLWCWNGSLIINLIGVFHQLLPRHYGGLSRPKLHCEHLPVAFLHKGRRSPRRRQRIAAAKRSRILRHRSVYSANFSGVGACFRGELLEREEHAETERWALKSGKKNRNREREEEELKKRIGIARDSKKEKGRKER